MGIPEVEDELEPAVICELKDCDLARGGGGEKIQGGAADEELKERSNRPIARGGLSVSRGRASVLDDDEVEVCELKEELPIREWGAEFGSEGLELKEGYVLGSAEESGLGEVEVDEEEQVRGVGPVSTGVPLL